MKKGQALGGVGFRNSRERSTKMDDIQSFVEQGSEDDVQTNDLPAGEASATVTYDERVSSAAVEGARLRSREKAPKFGTYLTKSTARKLRRYVADHDAKMADVIEGVLIKYLRSQGYDQS